MSDPVRLDYEWVVTGDSASTPIFSKSSQCFLALFLTDFQPLFSLNDPDGFFESDIIWMLVSQLTCESVKVFNQTMSITRGLIFNYEWTHVGCTFSRHVLVSI